MRPMLAVGAAAAVCGWFKMSPRAALAGAAAALFFERAFFYLPALCVAISRIAARPAYRGF